MASAHGIASASVSQGRKQEGHDSRGKEGISTSDVELDAECVVKLVQQALRENLKVQDLVCRITHNMVSEMLVATYRSMHQEFRALDWRIATVEKCVAQVLPKAARPPSVPGHQVSARRPQHSGIAKPTRHAEGGVVIAPGATEDVDDSRPTPVFGVEFPVQDPQRARPLARETADIDQSFDPINLIQPWTPFPPTGNPAQPASSSSARHRLTGRSRRYNTEPVGESGSLGGSADAEAQSVLPVSPAPLAPAGGEHGFAGVLPPSRRFGRRPSFVCVPVERQTSADIAHRRYRSQPPTSPATGGGGDAAGERD